MMTSKRMSAVDDDAPALAGAMVYHAGEVCESADHLRRVLGEVSIPVDGLTDDRQQHKAANGTEPMARVYLYQEIYDLAQSEVADRVCVMADGNVIGSGTPREVFYDDALLNDATLHPPSAVRVARDAGLGGTAQPVTEADLVSLLTEATDLEPVQTPASDGSGHD